MWSFLLLTTVVAQATARRPLWFPSLPYRVKHKQIEMPKTMEDKVTVLKDDIVRELTEVPDVDLEVFYGIFAIIIFTLFRLDSPFCVLCKRHIPVSDIVERGV